VRIGRAELQGVPRVVVVDGDEAKLVDADVIELLEMTPGQREAVVARSTETLPVSEVRLLVPLLPPSLRDYLTFHAHVEGMQMRIDPEGTVPAGWYEAPSLYFSNHDAVIGPGEDVAVPPGSELFDFELEVAAVIGRAGRDLTVEQARDHIAGYTIFNDWSARDPHMRPLPVMGPGKGKDFASTLGPWIVTADELESFRRDDRLDLRMRALRNGVEHGGESLANMGWSFEALVAYASRGTWVRPGDVLGSGTCGGGCLAELWGRRGDIDPPPLRPGDEITLEVEGIGSITNRVVAGAPVRPIPRARVAGEVR
jgi:2-keto-4-pentenoate hydratase/2-oxohepta-3-ene-1,7-dioic acid hydratase in catechol pathway